MPGVFIDAMGGGGFLLLCVLFAGTCWFTRPAAPRAGLDVLLLVRSAIPPILLAWCLALGSKSPLVGSLRLQPVALEASAGEAGQTLFRVGSGAQPKASGEPDLIVPAGRRAGPDAPYADLVTVATRAPSVLDVRLVSRAVPGGAILAMTDEGERTHYVGAVRLSPGDMLCLGDCATNGFTFDGNATLHNGRVRLELPVRTGPAGRLRPWAAEVAVYPLHAAALYQPVNRGGQDIRGSFPASFLFQDFSRRWWQPEMLTGRWHLAILDPGLTVMRHGKPLAPACLGPGEALPGGCTESRAVGADGREALPVRIARVNFGAGEESSCGHPAPAGMGLHRLLGENANPACRLIDRRRFTIALRQRGEGGAPVAVLTFPEGARETIALGSADHARGRISADPASADPASFVLDSVKGGDRADSPLAAAIEHFPMALRSAVTGQPDGEQESAQLCHPHGEDELCAGDDRRAIRFSLDEMRLPWFLVIVAVAGAIAFHAASAWLWRTYRVEGLVIAAVQMLLALRAVIAAEGVMIDPNLPWRDIYGECAMALVALPSILVALRPRAVADGRKLVALLLFDLLVAMAIWRWNGALSRLPEMLVLLSVITLAIRIATLGQWQWVRLPERQRSIDWIGRRGVALITVLVALRLLSPLIGAKERFLSLAISIYYLPPLLIGFAVLLAAAANAPATRWKSAAVYVLLALTAMGITFVARDTGFGLVYLWPLLGVAFWQGLLWRQEAPAVKGSWAWVLPMPAAVLLLYGALTALVVGYWGAPDAGRSLAERLEYSNRRASANDIRLIETIRPDWVAQIGNRDASQQMDQVIHLVERSAKLVANAYMQPSNLPIRQTPNLSALRDVHLTDNVAAVHLMAPFGRVAAFGLVLVLFSVAAGLCAEAPAGFWRRWLPLAGALAIWTVFGTATYMILANLLLVPFTGRNIYLLAPSSGSDLIEGLILFAMALVGLRGRTA